MPFMPRVHNPVSRKSPTAQNRCRGYLLHRLPDERVAATLVSVSRVLHRQTSARPDQTRFTTTTTNSKAREGPSTVAATC